MTPLEPNTQEAEILFTGLNTPPATPASSLCQELLDKIEARTAIVGVAGLGYVGLPFSTAAARAGFSVIGVEPNAEKAALVNAGTSYIGDVATEELAPFVKSGKIVADDNFDRVAEMDVIIICVPTPLTTNLTPDLSYVVAVAESCGKKLRKGQMIALESTTFPGTTEEVLAPILEKASGLTCGTDFFLVYSPERVDPGNQTYDTMNTNKVMGASDDDSRRLGLALYSAIMDTVVTVSSCSVAEMSKIFENTFRAVNIALVNELTLLCDRMGVSIWEVLDAANTKPYGIMPFYPGPGVGGHCIPLDPHYLEWKAKQYDFVTRFISLAGDVNRSMPAFVRSKCVRLLSNKGLALSKAKVLLIGVAYKSNVDDWRESPAIDVWNLLEERGANVRFTDPHVESAIVNDRQRKSVGYTAKDLAWADLVVVTTWHGDLDPAFMMEHADLILDTRGATRHCEVPAGCARVLL